MSERAWRGCFVALEGLDGAGTTTQARRLSAKLRNLGYGVLSTKEPSDRPVGRLLRHAISRRIGLPEGRGPLSNETLALLFAADRTDHLYAQIFPALKRGDVVLCDRYQLSSLAYQGATLPIRWVEAINAMAVSPDLTLFIEVTPQTALRRRQGRGAAPELFEEVALQRRIARRYAIAVRRYGKKHRIVRLDGSRSIEEVTEQALGHVQSTLKRLMGRFSR